MAAARAERRPSLRVSVRYSRLALALTVLAIALAALAVTSSRLANTPLAWMLWALLALVGGLSLREPGRWAGDWLFYEAADGTARLRSASGSIDAAPEYALRRRTCWPFLLVVVATNVADGKRCVSVVMIDALARDDFRRLAAWLRRARCVADAVPG